MSRDEDLMHEEPQEIGCLTELASCIVGVRVMVRASYIGKKKLMPGRGHRKQWIKADNAKCWVERAIVLRDRQR